MGTDCAIIGKAKGQNKVYRRSLDRLYCFHRLSAGKHWHEELQYEKPGKIYDPDVVEISDKINPDQALWWAGIRLAFLYSHKELLSKEIDFWYHVHWVGEFIAAVGALTSIDNVEWIALADDNSKTYDDLVFFGNAQVAEF